MKIDFDSSTQQTQTELNEKFFSIADPAFIFDLLRNKIYSNPILAVCRELACNALDAHREVGKEETPIVINLPSFQEPYFKVKDFGPGISPDRMDDVYLKYAASTKRDSNDQIGAFGIGAKSPFSYSDSFTIVTNHDGKCYNYLAFIDESRMGKLIQLSISDTTDCNGTEIIVPVKTSDIQNFVSLTEQSTRHWKVKPKFTGSSLNYRNVSPVVGTDDWFITNDRESYYERKIKVLVGEIEYNLDNVAAKSFCDLSILSAVTTDVYLRFNVGELSLSANRENIYLDNNTKEAIKNKMLILKSQYISIIRNKISSEPTYLDACAFVSSEMGNICTDSSLLGKIEWRNGIVVDTEMEPNGSFRIFEFYKKKARGYRGYSEVEKICHRMTHHVRFVRGAKFIIHDCGDSEATTKHLKPFFDENQSLKSIWVIHPNNSTDDSFDLDSFLEENNLHHFNCELLSKHNKAIRSRKPSDKIKMMVYKFDTNSQSFNVCTLADVKSDSNKKLVTLLHKDTWRNRKYPVEADKTTQITNASINSALGFEQNVTIYAVDENIDQSRIKSVFGDAQRIEDFIKDNLSKYDKEFFYETLWAVNEVGRVHGIRYDASGFRNNIKDQSSPILTYIRMYDNLKEIVLERKAYIETLRHLGKDRCNEEEYFKFCASKQSLHTLVDQIGASYPLLNCIDNWKFSTCTDHIVSYINLIDQAGG